jgi:glycosyltransferase involved in cell wall biosynthesis
MLYPKVSIIIPYSVDRGWLNEAIESVHAQTYKGEIELIISQSNNGVAYNLNRGIERATGDLIKYLCEDDWLTPNSIADSVKAIRDFDFIHGDALNHINGNIETQKPKRSNPSFDQMILNNVIHGGTLMYRRECFKDRMFDESLDCAEEYDFNLYLLKNGHKLGYCPRYLYNYRRHKKQKSLGEGVDQEVRRKKIHAIKMKYN